MKTRLLFAVALLVATPMLAEAKEKPEGRLAALLASTDGATQETAYKVKSVDEEYQILRARHLRPESQSLIMAKDGHPYDTLDAKGENGASVRLWFDIKSFYGHEFGF